MYPLVRLAVISHLRIMVGYSILISHLIKQRLDLLIKLSVIVEPPGRRENSNPIIDPYYMPQTAVVLFHLAFN